MLDSGIAHDSLRCMSEHVGQSQVDGLHAVGLYEGEAHVVGGLTDHVERRTFALGNLAAEVDGFALDEEAHTLLRLVAGNLLGAQGGVAHRQFVHPDHTTRGVDEFRQAVDVSACTMVVNRNDGIVVAFAQGTHHVVGTFLHLGVGTLHGIEFDARSILARIDRRHSTTAHTDAVVVATDEDNLLASLGRALQCVAHLAIAYATGQHDDLVVAIFLLLARIDILVLEGEE